MMLVGAFAAIALLLAALGIYGVISYAVTQRTQEIGIRIALGAGRASVLWMVLRQAGLLLAIGAVAGLAGVAATGRLLKGFIFGVAATDAGVLIAVTAVLCAVGLIAAWRPARRAASIDPMQALRGE
jgi:ABC-type antimicrobial peptide transport system permease subunit